MLLLIDLLGPCTLGQVPNEMDKNTKETLISKKAPQGAHHTIVLSRGSRLGVIAHHCSYIGDSSLIKVLLDKGMKIQRIFSPEHGFKGTAPDERAD